MVGKQGKKSSALEPGSNWWIVGLSVPTWMLAAASIVALLVSVCAVQKTTESNRQAAEANKHVAATLESVQKGLDEYTLPVVAIVNYKWAVPEGPVSPNNPPRGIGIIVKNLSPLPVELHASGFKVYYGEKLLDDVTRTVGDSNAPFIIGPGRDIASMTIQSELFPRYLADRQSLYDMPFLEIRYWNTTSRVNSRTQYRYETTRQIGFDPQNPKLKYMTPTRETIKQIAR